MPISIRQHVCSFILSNWSLGAFLESHEQNPSVSCPKLSLDESGLVFPAAPMHSEVANKGCLGFWKNRRGFMESNCSSFTFWKPWTSPLFSTSHSSLCSQGSYYHPVYLSNFLCSCSQATFFFFFHLLSSCSTASFVQTAASVDLLGTCYDTGACDVRWADCLPAAWHN